MLRDTAADDDALGREHGDHRHETQREVARLQHPSVAVLDLRRGYSPARLERRAGSEPLEAVAVIRTDAVERVGIEIVRDTQMPELGVEQAVQDTSVDDRAAADAAPTVTYQSVRNSRPAPQRCSPRAAAFTSVSNATGTSSLRRISCPTSMFAQPGFGVVVMHPQVIESMRVSTGPKEPMPIASTGPAREKKSTARPIVSFGVVVGIVVTAQRSSGPIPIAHSLCVPRIRAVCSGASALASHPVRRR
jgi:hypothetical protein